MNREDRLNLLRELLHESDFDRTKAHMMSVEEDKQLTEYLARHPNDPPQFATCENCDRRIVRQRFNRHGMADGVWRLAEPQPFENGTCTRHSPLIPVTEEELAEMRARIFGTHHEHD